MDKQLHQLLEEVIASRAVLDTYEAERTKMVGLLQDSLTQYLSALKMNLLALEPFVPIDQHEPGQLWKNIKMLVDESFNGIKRVTRFENFRTTLNIGLPSALNLYLKQLNQSVLKISCFIDCPENIFKHHSEMLIFRVIQELINNALLHSGAAHLDITVQSDLEGVSVIVEDDGCGFNLLSNLTKGKGIDIVLCRIEYLRGTVEWSSSKQGGTIVSIHVPMR